MLAPWLQLLRRLRSARVPTSTGDLVELTVRAHPALTPETPGCASVPTGTPSSATVHLAPGLLERAQAGDRAARLVVLHELCHVVLHLDVLRGGPAPDGRDLEAEADLFAEAVLGLLGG